MKFPPAAKADPPSLPWLPKRDQAQQPASIPPAKRPKQATSTNIIDLTNSDDGLGDLDDAELDKFIVKTPQIQQQPQLADDSVCFGTLHTFCVYPDLTVVKTLLETKQREVRVVIKIATSKDGLQGLQVSSKEEVHIGLVDATFSFVMLKFIKLLKIIPMLHLSKGLSASNTLSLSLTVQGPLNLAYQIGNSFNSRGIRFTKPEMFSQLGFFDPHVQPPPPPKQQLKRVKLANFKSEEEPAFGQTDINNQILQYQANQRQLFQSHLYNTSQQAPKYTGAPLNRAPINAIKRDDSQLIKGQIDAIYNSLSPAEDLPEVEQDERLLTKLFKHQKQALYFMIERERELSQIPLASSTTETATTAESMSLWRRDDKTGAISNIITRELWDSKDVDDEDGRSKHDIRDGPDMLRGGILADDMGLGKTIEAICLILHQPEVQQPPSESTPIIIDGEIVDLTPGSSEFNASLSEKERQIEEFKNKFQPAPVLKKKISKPEPALYPSQPSSSASSSSSFNAGYLGGKMKKSAPKNLPERKFVASRATLIVCPLSTVNNWEEQINAHVVKGSLRMYVYHGPQRTTNHHTLIRYDVVLTTYNLLSLEYNKELKSQNDPSKHLFESPLHRIKWTRVMLDEAHTIKEAGTSQARSACALATDLRWCLTGTPIQNKLEDLYSLLKFLKVEPFSSKTIWNKYFGKGRMESQEVGVSQLQTLMKSLTLRRTKQTKIKGVPIIQLPERSDYVVKIDLSETERKLYNRIEDKAYQLLESQESSSMYVHLLELMLRLRQTCVHIALCKDYESQLESLENEAFPELTPTRLAHLHLLLKEAGEDNCCFCGSKPPDAIEGLNERAPYITRCGHMFCTECTKNVFGKQPKVACPLCKTNLLQSEVCQVGSEEDNNDDDAIFMDDDLDDACGADSSRSLSTKINTLVNDLAATRDSCERENILPVKSIVFSQWTKVLDLIEGPLKSHDFQFARLDGKMNRAQRTAQLDKFKLSRYCNVLLISIRAGGVGLNLTHASRVYIMEPYWNPAVEQQAIDRVHRMGQTLPVQCIRFIVRDSIEESMVETQERKRRLVNMTFKDDEEKGSRKGKEELARERIQNMRNLLFGSRGYRKNRKEVEVIILD